MKKRFLVMFCVIALIISTIVSASATTIEPYSDTRYTVVSTAFIYGTASTSGIRLTTVAAGAHVKIEDYVNSDWLQVSYLSYTGYIGYVSLSQVVNA